MPKQKHEAAPLRIIIITAGLCLPQLFAPAPRATFLLANGLFLDKWTGKLEQR